MSDAAKRYDSLMRQLLELINQEFGDGPEADAIRDQMDAPWSQMTDDERDKR